MTDGAELGVSQSRSQVPHQSPRRVAHRLRTNPAPRGLSHGCFQQLGSSMRSKLPISSKCSKQQCYRWRNRVFGSLRTPFWDSFGQNPRSPIFATAEQRLRSSPNCQKPDFATHRTASEEPGNRNRPSGALRQSPNCRRAPNEHPCYTIRIATNEEVRDDDGYGADEHAHQPLAQVARRCGAGARRLLAVAGGSQAVGLRREERAQPARHTKPVRRRRRSGETRS